MPNLTKIVRLVEQVYKASGFQEPTRRGKQKFSDLYICQLVVVQNLKGYANESAYLRYLRSHPSKTFSKIPSQQQYNQRSKRLGPTVECLTATVLQRLKVYRTKIRIIDATGIPVVKYYRRYSTKAFSDRRFFGIGYCAAKQERYYGEKLTLVTTREGIPVAYHLMPANRHDVKALKPAVQNLTDVWLIGDKGYVGKKIHDDLKLQQRIRVITPLRKNQHRTLTAWERKKLKYRKLIEVINEQLKDHFGLEHLRAKSAVGTQSRIRNIIFSYALAVYFNKINGRNLLSIKEILG